MHERPTIIWDWNGTLLNDTEVCLGSINRLLQSRRLPELTHERYRQVFSFPVRDYYAAIGFDFAEEPFEVTAMRFIDFYQESLPGCPLTESATETLAFFAARGYRQAILSAMEHDSLVASVQVRGIAPYFEEILGISDHYAASKVDNAHRFFAEKGLDPDHVTLIGDTLHDAEVAEALGCRCLLLASGHQSPERLATTGHPVLSTLREVVYYFRD